MGKRIVFLSPEMLTRLMIVDRGFRVHAGLPADAKLIGHSYNAYPYNRFELVFESAAWAEQVEGEAIPALELFVLYLES